MWNFFFVLLFKRNVTWYGLYKYYERNAKCNGLINDA